MPWIDTHCHLYESEAFPDPARAIDEAAEAGVERLIVIGIDLETSRMAVDLADRFPAIFATVGLHPTHAGKYSPGLVQDLVGLAAHPKVVGWGEIGLDYYWDYSTPEEQDVALAAQLEIAEGLGLPVVFHCREAYPALLDRLEARWTGKTPPRFVLHCFAGTADDARRASALGAYFGVDGPVTYKKADGLREVLAGLPRDRVVIETDAPYLTPHPFRGERNHPRHIPLIGAKVGEVWGIDAQEQLESNSRALFLNLH